MSREASETIFTTGSILCYNPAMPPRPTPADRLAKLLGEHLKTLRVAAGKRQSDVAQAAKRVGVPWQPSTVGSIETGFRRLATDELLILPEVLAEAGIAGLAFEDVCPPALISRWKKARVQLAQAEAIERWDKSEKKMWLQEVGHEPDVRKVIGEDADGHPRYDTTQRRREPLPETIDEWGDGEPELAAADALGVHPRRVALRSWKLWKRSLGQERDARAAAITGDMDAAAVRGHVTRLLLRELGFRKSKSKKRRKG